MGALGYIPALSFVSGEGGLAEAGRLAALGRGQPTHYATLLRKSPGKKDEDSKSRPPPALQHAPGGRGGAQASAT